jgi:hypothetical protein
MSDGPHRSLPMRPAWKKAAERADKPAYSFQEVGQAISEAAASDWRAEVPDSCVRRLDEILGDRQLHLLEDSRVAQFAAVRRSLEGAGGLGGVLVDCAEQVAARGKFGEEALREAVSEALSDRVSRSAKQMEEHYHRTSIERGVNMRGRLAEAVQKISYDALTHHALRVGDRPVQRSKKQAGLDDGVPLP